MTTKWQLVSVVDLGGIYKMVLVQEMPGFWARLFGAKPRDRRFCGSGTVWNEYPSGKRVDSFKEACLADLVTRVEMQEIKL